MVIYNHTTAQTMRFNRPQYRDGKLFGFYVWGVKRVASAIYTLDTICDLLEFGFVTRPNGLSLELIVKTEPIKLLPNTTLLSIIPSEEFEGRYLLETISPYGVPFAGLSLFSYTPERIKATFGFSTEDFNRYIKIETNNLL